MLFLKAIAAFNVFSSSPSAKTTLFLVFLICELIPCIIVTDGSNLCFNSSEYISKFSIFFLATPLSIAALATATGITLISLGSKVDGIIYSLPYEGVSPPIAAATSSGTISLASSAIAFAAAVFISSFIVLALTSNAPLKIYGKPIKLFTWFG